MAAKSTQRDYRSNKHDHIFTVTCLCMTNYYTLSCGDSSASYSRSQLACRRLLFSASIGCRFFFDLVWQMSRKKLTNSGGMLELKHCIRYVAYPDSSSVL